MVKNRRNTRFFWVMLVVLCVSLYGGIMYATTYDRCGKDAPKKWEYLPPQWVCANR